MLPVCIQFDCPSAAVGGGNGQFRIFECFFLFVKCRQVRCNKNGGQQQTAYGGKPYPAILSWIKFKPVQRCLANYLTVCGFVALS
ncbi:Uncharacterised protein [Neisseria meningitidis]|nr:Uncharacterised protein [Neisseria meningitidis]